MQLTLAQWPYKQPAVDGFDPQSNSVIDNGSDMYAYRRTQFLNADPAVQLIEKCAKDTGLAITALDQDPRVAYKMAATETRRPWCWNIEDWQNPGNAFGPINQLFGMAFAQGFVPDFTKPWDFAGSFYLLPAPDPATGVPFGFKFNS
jgi:hypothetical protein